MSRRRPLRAASLLTLLIAATIAACGEVPEPAVFSVAPQTTVAEGIADDPPGLTTTTVASRLTPTTEFVPRRTDNSDPEVLIASDEGVLVSYQSTAEFVAGSLAGVAVTRVVDDLISGLVVQERDREGPVVWVPGIEAEPRQINEAGAELLDVGYAKGAAFAVLQDGDLVERVRLVDGERSPVFELESDEELIDLSVSGGVHAVAVANARCGDMRFYDADGSRLRLNGPGEPDCIVPRRPLYGAVAISPDGAALAYTIVTYRDDAIEAATELVVRDLSTGDEWFRRKIGEDFDRITALSFDGERVTYLRESAENGSVTVLAVTGSRGETQINLGPVRDINSVSFARLGVFNSG